jgi:hypothetical protein
LFAAKISFSCLNGNVPKQKLDLLQFASGRVTKPSTSPSLLQHADSPIMPILAR